MPSAMKMDVIPIHWTLVLSLLSLILLLIALIVGAAGPQVYTRTSYDAYQCPGNSRYWNDSVCMGVQLRNANQTFEQILPQMHLFSKLWILEVHPYKWQGISGQSVSSDIQFTVTILGSNDDVSDNPIWHIVTNHDSHSARLDCESSSNDCDEFVLVDEQTIRYHFYFVQISCSGSGAQNLGDVVFTVLSYTKEFGDEEISYRVIFLFFTAVAIVGFLFMMVRSRIPFLQWTFHQKAVVVLLISLFFYNDPFYIFTFVDRGWFFEFLNSLFETFFISVLLLFWLVSIDQLRIDQARFEPRITQVVMILVTGIYALLTVALFTWARVRAAEDPVYSERGNVTGILVLFWIVSSVYGAMIIWLIILVVMTIPVITRSKKHMLPRFLYLELPTIICILAVIVGIFTGTFGPFNRTALGFAFFISLYNAYVYILAFGALPTGLALDDLVDDTYTEGGNGEEEKPIAKQSSSKPPREVELEERATVGSAKVKGGADVLKLHDEL